MQSGSWEVRGGLTVGLGPCLKGLDVLREPGKRLNESCWRSSAVYGSCWSGEKSEKK